MTRSIAAVVAALLAMPASATPIDFTAALHNLDGSTAKECKEMDSVTPPARNGVPEVPVQVCKRVGDLTLGALAANALIAPDRNASAEDQLKRGLLAQRIFEGRSVDLTAEQVALIKAQAAKLGQPTLYLAQLVAAIDPNALKDAGATAAKP